MPPLTPRELYVRLPDWVTMAVALVLGLTFLYAIVEAAVFAWFGLVLELAGLLVALYVVYLFYYFVNSVGRIADAVVSGDRTTPFENELTRTERTGDRDRGATEDDAADDATRDDPTRNDATRNDPTQDDETE